MGAARSRLSAFDSTCPHPTFDLDLLDAARRSLRDAGADDYDLLNPVLGRTAFCELRQALHRPTARLHLLKTFNATLLSPWERAFLLAHFRRLAALDHPSLLRTLAVHDTHPDYFCVLFEDFQAPTLADWMDTAGTRLPPVQVSLVLTQLLDVLAYLHTHGLLHDHLDPAQLSFNGTTLKLHNLESTLPGHRGPRATPPLSAYSAPETVLFGHRTPQSAVWSLGVLAYQLTTGRHPFAGPDPAKVLQLIAANKPCMPVDHLLVSDEERDLLARLLHPDPAARPPLHRVAATRFLATQANAHANHLAKLAKTVRNLLESDLPPSRLEACFRLLYVCWLRDPPAWFATASLLFNALDRRGSGVLSAADLTPALVPAPLACLHQPLQTLFEVWGCRQDAIPVEVFLAALLAAFTPETPRNAAVFAATFELDSAGLVSGPSLAGALRAVHPRIRPFAALPEEPFAVEVGQVPGLLFHSVS